MCSLICVTCHCHLELCSNPLVPNASQLTFLFLLAQITLEYYMCFIQKNWDMSFTCAEIVSEGLWSSQRWWYLMHDWRLVPQHVTTLSYRVCVPDTIVCWLIQWVSSSCLHALAIPPGQCSTAILLKTSVWWAIKYGHHHHQWRQLWGLTMCRA